MTFGISATTATLIGAGATLGGAYLSSQSSKSAANTQANAAGEASAQASRNAMASIQSAQEVLNQQLSTADAASKPQIQAQLDSLNQQLAVAQQTRDQQLGIAKDVLGMQQDAYNPYNEAGQKGQGQLLNYLGIGADTGSAGYGKYATADFTPEMFKAGVDPGYAFRLDQGLLGLDRQAAARGGLISGNALKAASGFAGEQASQEYNNAYNRYQTTRTNTLAPYQGLTASGLNAATGLANAAGQYGQSSIGALGGYGSAAGSAYGNVGNTMTNIYGGLGGQQYSAYGNYGNQVTGALTGYGNAQQANTTGAGNALAAGQVGQANAITGGISGVTNQYYQNQMLGLLKDRNNPYAGATASYNSMVGNGGFGSGNAFGNNDLGQNF